MTFRFRRKDALILFVQTFGTLVTFQPHVHALVADGVFQPNGVFRVLPPIPTDVLEEGLREKVFALLKREGCIDDQLIARLRACAPGATPDSPPTTACGCAPRTHKAAGNWPDT